MACRIPCRRQSQGDSQRERHRCEVLSPNAAVREFQTKRRGHPPQGSRAPRADDELARSQWTSHALGGTSAPKSNNSWHAGITYSTSKTRLKDVWQQRLRKRVRLQFLDAGQAHSALWAIGGYRLYAGSASMEAAIDPLGPVGERAGGIGGSQAFFVFPGLAEGTRRHAQHAAKEAAEVGR